MTFNHHVTANLKYDIENVNNPNEEAKASTTESKQQTDKSKHLFLTVCSPASTKYLLQQTHSSYGPIGKEALQASKSMEDDGNGRKGDPNFEPKEDTPMSQRTRTIEAAEGASQANEEADATQLSEEQTNQEIRANTNMEAVAEEEEEKKADNNEKAGSADINSTLNSSETERSTTTPTTTTSSNNNDDLLAVATADLQALPDNNEYDTPPRPVVPGAFSQGPGRGSTQANNKVRYSILQRAHSPVFNSFNRKEEGGEAETASANENLHRADLDDGQDSSAANSTAPIVTSQATATQAAGSSTTGRAQRLARKREQINELGHQSRNRSTARTTSFPEEAQAGTNTGTTEPSLPVPAIDSRARSAPVAFTSLNSTGAESPPPLEPTNLSPEATPAGPLPPTGSTRSTSNDATETATIADPQQPDPSAVQNSDVAEESAGAFQERVRALGDIPSWARQEDATARPSQASVAQPSEQANPGTSIPAEAETDPYDEEAGESSGTDVSLIKAFPVEQESVPRRSMAAQPYDTDAAHERKARKAKQERCAMLTVVFVVLALVLILVIAFVPNWGQRKVEEEALPPSTTQSPTITMEGNVLSLLPSYTQESIASDATSPQARAYDWIMADPNLNTYSDERMIQRFALGALFYGTNGEDWRRNTNWMSYNIHECEWYANDAYEMISSVFEFSNEPPPEQVLISLQRYQNVSFPCEDSQSWYTHLWLPANKLQGSLPPETYLLMSLQTIVVVSNKLTGPGLPTAIAKLPSLEAFVVADNDFIGTIPTQIGLLSNLRNLVFADNKISGTVPSQFGLLSDSLRLLDLVRNELTGTIHPSLAYLSKMKFMALRGNELTGTIPSEFGLLSELRVLEMVSNQLTGPIPSELGLLENILDLWLDNNNLTGAIPLEIGNLVINGRLKSFHIHANNLTGTLPDDLCLIETYTDSNSQLIGCNCTCSFVHSGHQMCSPLPKDCQ